MPANIDSIAYTGEVPWHKSGTRLDNPMTAEQAIEAGGIGWNVVKEPIYLDGERQIQVKDRFVIRREDRLDALDGGQLGVVGRDYVPLQNKDAFSFLNPVVVGGRALYHTVGALNGGKQIWLLAKLPGVIKVVGEDITEKFLLLSNSHDGSSAVRILFTPIRVVCQNTLNLALRATSGLSIKHYSDVQQKVQESYRLLGIVKEAYDRAEITMKAMAKVSMTGDRLKQYFEAVQPIPSVDEEERLKVQQRHHRWEELFTAGDGNSLSGVRGTVWAAYNGITQWVDRESFSKRMKEPLKSIWFGGGRLLKERAFSQAERLLSVSLN